MSCSAFAPKRKKKGEDDLAAFRRLFAGVLPDQDLAMAAVARALDAGGGLRAEAEYFAHPYSDRDGNAFEGIRLQDAWSSDFELEVPDVDALAYIRGIGKNTTMKAPLDGNDHNAWYPQIGASLKALRHRVHVVRALAAVWFEGSPDLPYGYDASIDIMNATLADLEEDPAALSERLEEDGLLFLQKQLRHISGMGVDGWDAGNARRDDLVSGARVIRQSVLAVLREEGLVKE